jgi:hypothetical protein
MKLGIIAQKSVSEVFTNSLTIPQSPNPPIPQSKISNLNLYLMYLRNAILDVTSCKNRSQFLKLSALICVDLSCICGRSINQKFMQEVY